LILDGGQNLNYTGIIFLETLPTTIAFKPKLMIVCDIFACISLGLDFCKLRKSKHWRLGKNWNR